MAGLLIALVDNDEGCRLKGGVEEDREGSLEFITQACGVSHHWNQCITQNFNVFPSLYY